MKRNRKTKKLTPEELRKYSGLNNVSEMEAVQVIEALEKLSFILINLYKANLIEIKDK